MTISVTQLNNYIRGMFSIDAVLNNLSVCGEITNLKRSYNGWYFSLKDDEAYINCFCFANTSEPKQGSVVVVEGELNYFVKTGSVSFFVRKIASTNNLGAAYQKFVELRDKLAKEGLFEELRKKPVPHSANKIGVVTSATGAVIHDIVNVALRRQPFSNIFLYPVKVQGDGAAAEIVEGVRYFDKSDVDVVIVGRGGGSEEDLSVFNTEIVVRAISEASKPIVSAVGHGVDFTLADFAADKRAVTPSEAAEFVTLDSEAEKQRIAACIADIRASVEAKWNGLLQDIQTSCKMLHADVKVKLENLHSKVCYSLRTIQNGAAVAHDRASAAVVRVTERLNGCNPMTLLQRGYGYVSCRGGAVRSVKQLDVGEQISVVFFDGNIDAKVTRMEEKK